MKVTGDKKLVRQFSKLPGSIRKHVSEAIRKTVEQTAQVARTLVPVDSGELKDWIHTKYDRDGMRGSVEAAPPTKRAQTKAMAVEFGRTKGEHGTTTADPYIRRAQAFQRKRVKGRIKRAINKAAKEAFNG